MVSFGCYFGAYMRIPVLPLFARQLGADTFEIGIITSLFMMVAGALCVPLGLMSDRLGRKRLILAGLLVSVLTSFVLIYCTSPKQLMGVYLVAGAGIAAFAPTMMSMVSDFTPKTHLGRSYGWYTMALYGGMSMGPAMGGLCGQLLGFKWVFAISGVVILLMFWPALMFLPQPHTSARAAVPGRGSGAIFSELLRNRSLLACWLVTLSSCFGLGMFITFIPLHASDQGVEVGQIGLIFATQAVVNALCRIPFGYLSDWVSDRKNLVLAGLFGYSFSIAGLGISTALPMFIASAFLMGISMGVAFTAVGALIAEVVPADSRGLAMGGYNTCIYVGIMLCALIMGVITRDYGFRAGFLITAVISVAGASAFLFLFRTQHVREGALTGN